MLKTLLRAVLFLILAVAFFFGWLVSLAFVLQKTVPSVNDTDAGLIYAPILFILAIVLSALTTFAIQRFASHRWPHLLR